MSALKDARTRASKVLKGPAGGKYDGDKKQFINQVRDALYASKICSYAQGYVQLQAAAKEHNWPLNYGDIALLWRGGCIIRAVFLQYIKEAFDKEPNLENLLLAPYFQKATADAQEAWRNVIITSVKLASRCQPLPRPGLLRRLSPRTPAGELAPSPTRLLWRSHLQPNR